MRDVHSAAWCFFGTDVAKGVSKTGTARRKWIQLNM